MVWNSCVQQQPGHMNSGEKRVWWNSYLFDILHHWHNLDMVRHHPFRFSQVQRKDIFIILLVAAIAECIIFPIFSFGKHVARCLMFGLLYLRRRNFMSIEIVKSLTHIIKEFIHHSLGRSLLKNFILNMERPH